MTVQRVPKATTTGAGGASAAVAGNATGTAPRSMAETKDRAGIGTSRVELLDRATKLVVTAGEQLFAPVQYFSFRVGAAEMTIDLRKGDDPQELAALALTMLREIQEEEFRKALPLHKKLVEEGEKAFK